MAGTPSQLDAKVTYFVKCARFRTLREAAASIGLTQSAPSTSIREFEEASFVPSASGAVAAWVAAVKAESGWIRTVAPTASRRGSLVRPESLEIA